MNRLGDLIKSVPGSPAVSIHIGAGTCNEHESYEAINSGKIIYVEADPYLAGEASELFDKLPRVKIISSAIASEAGTQSLKITNNRRFSSLLSPGELLDFYPNTKVEKEPRVKTITLAQLCQQEALHKDTDNLLVVELQGLEKEIFPLLDLDTLQTFKWIILRSSELDLYTPASNNNAIKLKQVIQKSGFLFLAFEEDAPPFINILCIRNDAEIDNTRLRNHRSDLLDTIRVLEHNLSKQLASISDLQTKHEQETVDWQVSIESANKEMEELQKEINGHSSTIEKQSSELEKARSLVQTATADSKQQQKQITNFSNKVKSKSTELEKVRKQLEAANTGNKVNQKEINKLSGIIEATTAELKSTIDKLQSATGENKDLQDQIENLSGEIETLTSDLTSTRSQLQTVSTEDEDKQLQIDKLTSSVETRTSDLNTVQTQLQSATVEGRELQQKIHGLSNAVNFGSAELEKVQASLQSAINEKEKQQQQINEYSKVIETKTAELNSSNNKLQVVTREKENLQQEFLELGNTSKSREAELNSSQAQLKSANDEKGSLHQQLESLTESLNKKESEMTGIQQTLRINNKLILKSDADLRDLQVQYRASLQHQEQQHALLCELKQKLRQASEFYQKLNLRNLVLDAEQLEQADTENSKPGSGRKKSS